MHLLSAGPCSECVTGLCCFNPTASLQRGCCIYQPVFWVKSMKHRDGKVPAQGHTAGAFGALLPVLREWSLVMQGLLVWLTLALCQLVGPVWPCSHRFLGQEGTPAEARRMATARSAGMGLSLVPLLPPVWSCFAFPSTFLPWGLEGDRAHSL